MTWTPPLPPNATVEFYTIEKRNRGGAWQRVKFYRGQNSHARASEEIARCPTGWRMVQCLVIQEN